MKRILIFILAGTLLASCGSTRKSLSSQSQSEEAAAKSKSQFKTDSSATSATIHTKTKTTTTTIDTTATVPGDSLKGTIHLKPDAGTQEDSLEGGGIKIKTTYDPTTGKLHVNATSSPRSVPVKATTSTTETETLANTSTGKISTETQQSQSTKTALTTQESSKEVTQHPFWLFKAKTIIPLMLIILALLILVWRNRSTVNGFIRWLFSKGA